MDPLAWKNEVINTTVDRLFNLIQLKYGDSAEALIPHLHQIISEQFTITKTTNV